MKSIYIAGSAKETFYIDDMKLVAMTLPEDETAVSETEAIAVPSGYALSQNVPNPFNPHTTIRYALPEAGVVRLSVYNVVGQSIRTLVDGYRSAGTYSAVWAGKSASGRDVASGVYVYRLKVEGGIAQTRRMVLLR